MPKEKLKGLAGWLVFPILGLFVSILSLLYDIFFTAATYELDFYIGFLVFIDLALLAFVVITLVAMFNKKKYLPKLMIAFYSINIVLTGIIAILIEDFTDIIAPIVAASIWIPYFITSKRVKNTFVK